MDKFKNMYEAIFSHIEYSNYLEEYGQINTLLSRVNYNLLMSIYCGIYLLTVVNPLIDKKSNGDVKINLDQAFLNELIKRVATDNGSGYTIGELSYKDANTVLFKIRNKLAHGDYVVTNNNIIFEENGKKGIVNIDKLSIMIVELDNSIRDYKSKGKINGDRFVTDDIIIGNNVWIGANSIILKGSEIGNDCVIAAGTVVNGKFEENTLIYNKKELIGKKFQKN